MTGLAVAALVFAASAGAGLAVLAALGVFQDRGRAERLCWAFAPGIGALGWITFFPALAGGLGKGVLFGLCAVCASGLVLLRRRGAGPPETAAVLDLTGRVLVAGIVVALGFDLMEAMAPPADADTLSYHFALPQRFLEAGRLEFVPRAGTGAAPLLLQMTYLLALGLGGETALTLWTMASGWMAAALLFVIARRHLGLNWSLAAALLFLTTPAVLYGAGSGQVETRLALFALAAAFAAAEALRTGEGRYALLSGLAAGFYAGSKYMGLLFAAACGLVLLAGAGWLRRGVLYGLAVLVAGAQWYVWNWINTGDPTFPVLFAALGLPDSAIWDRAHDAYYRAVYFATENPLPRNLFGYVAYPFIATFGGNGGLEAGRTGLGPYAMLVLPFAVAGLVRFRHRLRASRLLVPTAIAALFYTLWFFSGTSQRVRHLLPVYPILVIALTVAAARWAETRPRLRPLAAAAAVAIVVQLGGQTVFSVNAMRYLFGGESREAFYRRTVSQFDPVPWINAHLTSRDRVLVTETQLVYLIRVPKYFAHIYAQVLVDLTPRARDPARFLRQLRAQRITHLLVPAGMAPDGGETSPPANASMLPRLTAKLIEAGCARVLVRFAMKRVRSRTLTAFGARPVVQHGAVVKLETEKCRL